MNTLKLIITFNSALHFWQRSIDIATWKIDDAYTRDGRTPTPELHKKLPHYAELPSAPLALITIFISDLFITFKCQNLHLSGIVCGEEQVTAISTCMFRRLHL